MMVPANQLRSNNLGYKRKALIVKNSFEFSVAISEAWLLQSLKLEVDLLQFLKPKPYTSNASLVRAFIGWVDTKSAIKLA